MYVNCHWILAHCCPLAEEQAHLYRITLQYLEYNFNVVFYMPAINAVCLTV